jgi:putative endonuclease
MAFWVYILRSTSTGALYCGQTSDLDRRIAQHNDPTYTATKTTKRRRGPWILIWQEEHPTRARAIAREAQIKAQGVRRSLARFTRTSDC